MKKLIFGLATSLLLATTSCNKISDIVNSSVSTADLPANTTKYLESNFPESVVTDATKLDDAGNTLYLVKLSTQEDLAFDKDGSYQGTTEDVVSKSKGGKGAKGSHGGRNRNCGGRKHGHGNDLSIDSLPAAISAYVAANYTGFVLKHAHLDSLCALGSTISVVAASSTAHVRLFFSTSGSYLGKVEKIDAATLPAAITAAISSNYAGYTAGNKALLLTLQNGTLQYGIRLTNGTLRKRVLFSSTGTVICEK
jgi:hypothetical protein